MLQTRGNSTEQATEFAPPLLTIHPAKMRGVLVVLGRDTEDPNAKAAAPPPAAAAGGGGGGGGPGAGVSAFVLATAVVAAFLGGIGLSAFALRRRAAT